MKDFKVMCISDDGSGAFTEGNIYEFKDGKSVTDAGYEIHFDNVDELNGRYHSQFELVEESKMFTKDDIRANDLVFFKNENYGRAIEFGGRLILVYENPKDNHDDFQFIPMDKIKKIYRPIAPYQLRIGIKDGDYGTVVFDRENGIGCEPPIKEITVEEATKLLTDKFGENVKIVVGK